MPLPEQTYKPKAECLSAAVAVFECPRCRSATTFRPAVHEAVFGVERVSRTSRTYLVACKHCRRQFYFAIPKERSVEDTPAD